MALSDWPFRRLAGVWAIGLLAQMIITVVPMLFLRWYLLSALPKLNRDVGTEERWRVAEQADRLMIAKQQAQAARKR